ncbi:MAG: hypothetical protein ACJ754_24140 [Pyrinomonadaceae bacterium]
MSKRVSLMALALCAVVSPVRVGAQEPQAARPKPARTAAKKPSAEAADPMAELRRTTAISLVSTLADDARTFRDPALRARVQARAADALWDTEREKSLALFRRAWDEAEAADAEADRRVAEDRARQQRERGYASVQLPPSLRSEVLRLAAKRDRALGEEFLTRLDEARKKELESAATSNERPTDATNGSGQPTEQGRPDPMETPPALAKRLRLAIQMLDEVGVERATQFADPALGLVTPPGLEFLTRLRAKNAQAADERYAAMLGRAASNPASDANTASLLASYLFSPTLYMTFSATAGSNANSWGSGPGAPQPPLDVPPQIRAAYFRAAASILLRPTPTPDQDRTSAGRAGWYMVITRLLPLFDQYAPDRAAALRGKQASLAPDAPEGIRGQNNNALTRGLVPEDPNRDRVGETLGRLDRAKTADERDAVYVDAAFDALRQKDPRLEEFLGKIEDTDTRQRLRAYIDMEAAREAVNEKNTVEALRLARGNTLTSIQRTWVLTEAARLTAKEEPGRAVEILDEALNEAKEHIDPASKERVSALVAIATQLYDLDRARTWEVMLEVVKAANSAKEYTGEDGRISTRFQSKNMTMASSSSAQSFDLTDIFTKLAREELQRAADLARSFEGEAPRSFATLAVARSVLDHKAEKKQERAAN